MQSPPLIERLRQMMNDSDNVMAESIGREVAAEQNRPQSFDGAAQAVLGQLEAAKIDTGGARLLDSSGLSVDDRLTAETLDGVVNAAAGTDQPQAAAAGRSAADRRRQRHAVQPLPRHRRRPRRRGIPAGQDRIVDRNQFAGRHRHRRQRAGADVLVDLQQRRADRAHRDRRAGRHPAVVRVQHMSQSTKCSPSAAPSTGSSPRPSAPSWPGPARRPPTTPAGRSSISWPRPRATPSCRCAT